MPTIAGRKALVRVPGTALTLTAEAAANSGDNKTYRITNTAKRILDPQATITVLVAAVATGEVYTLNRLRGEVVFATVNAGRGVVTITGSYLPMASAAATKSYAYSLAASQLDVTTFDSANTNVGFIDRIQGTFDVSGSLGLRWSSDFALRDALLNAPVIVIEFYSDRAAVRDLACWALLNKRGLESAIDSSTEITVEFQGTADRDGIAASL